MSYNELAFENNMLGPLRLLDQMKIRLTQPSFTEKEEEEGQKEDSAKKVQ